MRQINYWNIQTILKYTKKAKKKTNESESLETTIIAIKWVKVAQSCSTLCDPIDCSSPESSAHWILQARILEWVTVPFSKGSSRPRDRTRVSFIAGRFSTVCTTKEACANFSDLKSPLCPQKLRGIRLSTRGPGYSLLRSATGDSLVRGCWVRSVEVRCPGA